MSIHLFDYLYDHVDMSTTTTFTMKSLENYKSNTYHKGMELNHYQKAARVFAIYKDPVIYPALGLASEAGEVCGKVKKILRDKSGVYSPEDKKNIESELGDVLWYVAAVANDLGIDLEEVAAENLKKLNDRWERNRISGSGDKR